MRLNPYRCMQHTVLSLLFLILLNIPLSAQIAVGQWRDHLPYRNGNMVADAGDLVYYAAEDGLISYHKEDGEVTRISKVTGLSDIGYSAISFSSSNNTLVIAYRNTNLDLIQNQSIINIPDIRDKQILGNKSINNIHLEGDFAYLACGFGIVVLDIVRKEIKETYYIGPQGAAVNVYDISATPTEFVACTELGVFHAPKTGVNLSDFSNWQRYDQIPAGRYNAATFFDGRLYANLSSSLRDTVYVMNNGQWSYHDTSSTSPMVRMESTAMRLLLIRQNGTYEYNTNLGAERLVLGYGNNYALPAHATVDADRIMWVADRQQGLVRIRPNYDFEYIGVNGPSSKSSFAISVWDNRCYVASGGFTVTLTNQFNPFGYYTYQNNTWQNVSVFDDPQTAELRDIVNVLADPFDSRRVYATSWGGGLLEYYDNELVARYDTSNSTLRPRAGTANSLLVYGLAMERNRTLWVTGAESGQLLYAKAGDGSWHSFGFNVIGNITLGEVAIDNLGQKWVVLPRGAGLLVFNDNGTLTNKTDDKALRLSQNIGNGNLASITTTCVTTDLNGQVWVGTDNGVSVFFSPGNVFSGNNFDSQRILVEQDGYFQYLLENERVTTIQVDGANRKWIGTEGAGAFLMSADGTKQIMHFNKDNSPLFSNNITSIGIDHLSGEVYFGTANGLLSYRGTATYGVPEFDKEQVYAFPNPVRHDYAGPIAIKGLVRDADIKITDASGRTIYTTRAEGGQAIWDGRSLGGNRATTGVYLVFASDTEGNETFVSKILFIQ
jgi:hypothetical protein